MNADDLRGGGHSGQQDIPAGQIAPEVFVENRHLGYDRRCPSAIPLRFGACLLLSSICLLPL